MSDPLQEARRLSESMNLYEQAVARPLTLRKLLRALAQRVEDAEAALVSIEAMLPFNAGHIVLEAKAVARQALRQEEER